MSLGSRVGLGTSEGLPLSGGVNLGDGGKSIVGCAAGGVANKAGKVGNGVGVPGVSCSVAVADGAASDLICESCPSAFPEIVRAR